jgi:hypothetical protein
MRRSAPCFSPLLWCTYSTLPPLLHVSFQFLIYCSVFFFSGGGGKVVSLPRELCWFIPGGLGEYRVMLGAHLLVCWMSPKQIWSQHLVVVWAILFSQCNMAWRSFPRARGSGYWSSASPWCFISAKCGSSVSSRLQSRGAHAVCFCTLVAILSGPLFVF